MIKNFPNKRVLNSKEFYLQYINYKNEALMNINFKKLDKIINQIKITYRKKGIIYSCGNGGSSSLSDHFTCDFIKQSNNKTKIKLKSISLTSNFALISAIANDISYDEIFSFQIDKLGQQIDLLFLFSVSGNSKNLIKAVKTAKLKKIKTVSFTGFNGGWLSKNTDFNINFPVANYGIVEDCHISMMHYLSQYVRNLNIKKQNFKNINF